MSAVANDLRMRNKTAQDGSKLSVRENDSKRKQPPMSGQDPQGGLRVTEAFVLQIEHGHTIHRRDATPITSGF